MTDIILKAATIVTATLIEEVNLCRKSKSLL
ncbi:hypothetical protein HYQ60_0515 [Lactobacillus crispatus]|nr:hypothetical protein [Lactobacillus crispatus]